MNDRARLQLPIGLLVLDVVGAGIFALGLVKQFAHMDILPTQLQFDHYDIVFMIIGFGLILPLPFYIVLAGIKRAKANMPAPAATLSEDQKRSTVFIE